MEVKFLAWSMKVFSLKKNGHRGLSSVAGHRTAPWLSGQNTPFCKGGDAGSIPAGAYN